DKTSGALAFAAEDLTRNARATAAFHERLNNCLQPAASHQNVVVNKEEHIVLGSGDTGIPRAAHACSGAPPIAELAAAPHAPCKVGITHRALVNNDELGWHAGALQNRFHRLEQELRSVARRDNQRNLWKF